MLLTIQERLATLIGLDPYFAGASILTDKVGDLAAAYQKAISKLSFAVVVTVPSGEIAQRIPIGPVFRERVEISVCQSVLTDKDRDTRNVMDGLEHVISAVHGELLDPLDEASPRFLALSHTGGTTTMGESVQTLTVEIVAPIGLDPEEEPDPVP